MNDKACDEILPLLAGQTSGLLDAGERSALEAHLLGCDTCPAFAKELEAALAGARFERREPSETVWERIERGIREERAGLGPATALRILLACTFCKGGLDRKEALYCAACLAPHHRDCLETYGRCSAMGCGETRTVAPRERGTKARRPRRLAAFLVALVASTGTVAAVAARRASTARHASALPPALVPDAPRVAEAAPGRADPAAALAAVGEPEAAPVAWPWGKPTGPVAERLLQQKLTFNFSATPLSEVVAFLRDFIRCEIALDPAIDPEQVKIDLRLRDVTAWNALEIIANQGGFAFAVDDVKIHIAPRDAIMPDRACPSLMAVAGLFGPSESDLEVTRRLQSQKISANFDATPFADAIDTLHDLTSIDFVVTQLVRDHVDGEALKVSLVEPDQTVGAVLDKILGPFGFAAVVERGLVMIRLAAPPAILPELATKRVSLAGRGLTVADLARALRAQGVETYPSPVAWASRGTFSLAIGETTLEEALAAVASATALRPRIVHVDSDDREAVVIEGRIASARDALRAPLPRFTGVAAEVVELRDRLGRDLVARRAARADSRLATDELHARERAVELSASAILSLIARADAVARADERLAAVHALLDTIPAAVASAQASRKGLDDRAPELAALDERLAKCRAAWAEEGPPLKKRAEDLDRDTRSVDTEAVDKMIEAKRVYENALRKYQDESDLLEKERRSLERDLQVQRARVTREIQKLRERERAAISEEGVIRRDLEVLRRLDRGARMAEAESP